MVIFLSGTMRGDWTEKFEKALPKHLCHNPKNHGLVDPKNYTRWDLGMISRADVVLAYMNEGNPSGVGLALEVGFAVGIGVPVVLVLEKGVANYRYWQIVKQSSDFCFDSLDEAIGFFKRHSIFPAWGPR